MYGNTQSPIMIISGKKAQKILQDIERPVPNHAETVNKAKEKLKRLSTVKYKGTL